MVSPRTRPRGKPKDPRGSRGGEKIDVNDPATGPALIPIADIIQNVSPNTLTPLETNDEELLSLSIEQLRERNTPSISPKIALFRDALLEGQLSSPEMKAARGKTVEEAAEAIASALINSAVDNSAM